MMGAVSTALIAIAAVVLSWITIEVACKPCLDKGREAIDRSLDPNYDPDDISPAQEDDVSIGITTPLINPNQDGSEPDDAIIATTSTHKIEQHHH
ncbi:hypothetical protein GIB67_031707 [Kingdonia uniflora]|uniref:Outer envelope membrane protein 7 n=1 Tax=Kingdonia uniflora TaxID=39325 RepID=A0A7J7NK06_9MAGN|nr:hypothetical protein GIB67_031707 [Kingdonia uniflora]